MKQESSELLYTLKEYFKMKDITHVYLFGSYASYTQTKNSDIDIVIIKKTKKRFFERMKEYSDLQDILNVSVDILVYTPYEWSYKQYSRLFKNAKLIEI